ncbi:hypothetical protein NGC37_15620 [Pantoea anthophila]|uniref:hypothetical protein n=1 Tax=Pantoea anthophila TaxID=470931 RepID=UPI002DBD0580|nr:hypothetical protein [Pantoea anthophila]MEB7539732.1 hypothetical protein [Pantoea anthophila]
MHPLLEMLSDLLVSWPVSSGKRDKKPVKDKRKISGLDYKPVCRITSDQKIGDMKQKDENK